MTEKFGKKIEFIRIGVENKALLNHFYYFAVQNTKDLAFDSDMFAEYVAENHSTHATGLRKRDFNKQKIGRFITLLRKRGAIASTLKRAFKGSPQVYLIKSNTFVIPDGNIPINGIKPKRKLTLDDVDRFDGYDLAFIGYSLRKELDILNEYNNTLEAQNKKLKKEAGENKLQPYINKIEAMQREHRSELKGKDDIIKDLQTANARLNKNVTDKNRHIDAQDKHIDRITKSLEMATSKDNTFKVGEVAKITKRHHRPAHLKGN